MTSDSLFTTSVIIFLLGILSSFINYKKSCRLNKVAHTLAAVACMAVMLCAMSIMVNGTYTNSFYLWGGIFNLIIRIDNLAAIFLFFTGLVGFLISLYAIGYCNLYRGQRLNLMCGLYNLLLLSIVLVLVAGDGASFIIAWELMALASFLLVYSEWEREFVRSAALIYAVMTGFGTVFLFTAFFLMAIYNNTLEFSNHSSLIPGDTKNIIFICALIGFGVKGGLMPFHLWLPRAYGATPSYIVAIMSGIMAKTAVYGFCRFIFEFLGPGPIWWGLVVILVAIITCVFGALYSYMEKNLKHLLAYSSIENMGLIMLSIGTGMVFMSMGLMKLAIFAYIAGLFHLVSHMLFKSALFMSAGSVVQRLHTPMLSSYGGLIKHMPYTAGCFLIAAMAIIGLPPFNGFVGEWMIFQSLFNLYEATNTSAIYKTGNAILIALFSLTSALAMASFMKAFGITFLGKERTDRAQKAKENSFLMLVPISGLLLACFILGVYPSIVVGILENVLNDILIYKTAVNSVDSIHINVVSLNMTYIILALTIAAMLGVLLYCVNKPKIITGPTWACGIITNSNMQYSDVGFSKPVQTAFKCIFTPSRNTIVNTGDNKYYGRNLSYKLKYSFVFKEYLYGPLTSYVFKISRELKAIQSGSLQLYIGYILGVTILVMLYTAWGD